MNEKSSTVQKGSYRFESTASERHDELFSRFQQFADGEVQLLADEEFVRSAIRCFNPENCPEPFALSMLLEGLLPVIWRGERELRERMLLLLFHASEFFLENCLQSGVLCCNFILREWLHEEREFLSGTEAVIRQFSRTLIRCLQQGEPEPALASLELLESIRSGGSSRPAALHSLVSRTLTALPEVGLLEDVFRLPAAAPCSSDLAQQVLELYGTAAVPALLGRLAGSSRDERAALRQILLSFGEKLLPALLSCLAQNPPWAVARAALSLIGEVGSEADYRHIEPWFSYPDVRVQQEALNVVSRLSQERRRERFLTALPLVDESLCLDLLAHLLELDDFDEAFYSVLLRLAARRSTFSFARAIDLLSLLLTGLKAYPREETLELLKEMRRDYQSSIGGAQIVLLIDDALSTVAPRVRHSVRRDFDSDNAETDAAAGELEALLVPVEKEIHRLLTQKDEHTAGQYIYQQTERALAEKNYQLATHLKNRLVEVDPFALKEMVRLGELIDSHRSRAISPDYLRLWSRLSEALTADEFNTLYRCSRTESYDQGDTLVRSGDMDRSLFMLNSGSVSLSCRSGGMERFLRRVSPGIILGGEQFFDASVWTVTLKALSPVQVQVVGQKAWSTICEECPEIGDKLREFCAGGIDISRLITLSGDDRRATSRYIIHARTRHSFLDPVGRRSGRSARGFKGELLDFSRGGVAFSLKFASRDKAMKMLGRQLLTALELDDGYTSDFPGLVVGVRLHDPLSQSYSVHVKFAREIDGEEFLDILQATLPDS